MNNSKKKNIDINVSFPPVVIWEGMETVTYYPLTREVQVGFERVALIGNSIVLPKLGYLLTVSVINDRLNCTLTES